MSERSQPELPEIDAAVVKALRAAPSRPVEGGHLDDAVLLDLRAGALDAPAAAHADAHLATCAECRELLAAYAGSSDAPLELPVREAQVIPLRRKSWAYVAAGAVAAAAASLLAAVITTSSLVPPPPYELAALEGQVASTRGATPEPAAEKLPVFLPHSRLLLSVRPVADLEGPLPHAAAWLFHEDGTVVRAPESAVIIGEGGAVVLSSKAEALFGTRHGRWTVALALAQAPDALADFGDTRPAAAGGERDGVRWLSASVLYRGEAE